MDIVIGRVIKTGDLNDIVFNKYYAYKTQIIDLSIIYLLKLVYYKLTDSYVSILNKCCIDGNLHILMYLHSIGLTVAHIKTDNIYALTCAARFGHLSIVKYLCTLWLTADDIKSNQLALNLASANGHFAIVKYLYSRGGLTVDDLKNVGDLALTWAAIRGHIQIVKYLYTRGYTVEYIRKNAKLIIAVVHYKRYTDVLRYFYSRGFDRVDAWWLFDMQTPSFIQANEFSLSVLNDIKLRPCYRINMQLL